MHRLRSGLIRHTLHDAASGLHIGTVQIGDQRLRVGIRPGRGVPLLFCNGIGANLELVMPFVKALDPDLEVIAFDVPGVGGSSTPATPFRFPGLAKLAVARRYR